MSPVNWLSLRVSAVVGFGLVLLVLLALLSWGPGAGRPHDVPVGVVAPGVTGQLLQEAVSTSGELTPVDVETVEKARELLAKDELVAVVVVDMSRTEDVLLVDRGRNPDLVEQTVRRIESIEHTYGRTARVEDATEHDAGLSERIDWATSAAVGAGLLLGLVTATIRWIRRVPVAGLPRTALALVPGSFLIGGALALLPALATSHPWWFATIHLSVGVGLTAGITVACMAANQVYGGAASIAMHLVMVAPLLNHVDDHLLPQPWHAFFPLTGPGAIRVALTNESDRLAWQPLLVLAVWMVAAGIAGRRAVSRSESWHAELPLLHTATAAFPAAAAVVVITLLLPTGPEVPTVEKVLATSTECVDPGPVRTVRDLNRIAQLRLSEEFGGADVGATATLQDGRVVWLFGDTVRERGGTTDFTRNSMLVMDPECIQVVRMPDGGAVIPNRSHDVGYWPMSVTATHRQGFDLLTVTAQRVRSSGDGAWDFTNLGPSVAMYVVPMGGVPQLMAVRDVGRDSADRSRPMWGAASTVHDGWLYLYGTASPGEDLVFGFSLQVARVRPDDVLDEDKWRWFDGEGWVGDPGAAQELVPAESGTSQTLSVWEHDGTWYALSKRDEYLGSEIVVWTAPGPTGPFTAQPPVKDLPSDLDQGQLRYMPLAHPGLLPRKGTVVVSWSNNRSDPQEIIDDPLLYRPRFARVELPQ